MRIRQLLLMGVLTGLTACSTFSGMVQPASITHVDFLVTGSVADEYSATVKLKFKNPNTYAVQAGTVQYKLSIDGDTVTQGQFDKAVDIQPNSEAEVIAKIKFKYVSDQQNPSKNLIIEPYVLAGSASVGLHTLHFSHDGEFISTKKAK